MTRRWLLWTATGLVLLGVSSVAWSQSIPSSREGTSSAVAATSQLPSGQAINAGVPPSLAQGTGLSVPPSGSEAVLAMSTPSYPVSPGDVYELSYLQSVQQQSAALFVQSDYEVDLGIFKTVNARGMTFTQLRKRIVEIVTAAYPESSPQLVIRSLGTFPVALKGDVTQTGYYPANGLTRLDAFLNARLEPYSSTRSVEVRGTDGGSKTYDLFLATRKGELSQNPYVRPDEEVIVHRAERIVHLSGAVHRPGTYQLLRGDTLETLITNYGEGFTAHADPAQIRIERQQSAGSGPPQSIFVDALHLATPVALSDQDSVFVPKSSAFQPVVFLEGAVRPPATTSAANARRISTVVPTPSAPGAAYAPSASRVLMVPFSPGDTVSYFFQVHANLFSSSSDLAHAELIRNGKVTNIDLLKLLYYPYGDQKQDLVLRPYDRILVPFQQVFVSVTGAVINPGNYPFVPGRDYGYYTGLAGGIDRSKHVGAAPIITNKDGEVRPASAPIQPEDQINYAMNSPTIRLGPYIEILGGLASLATLVYDIVQIVR